MPRFADYPSSTAPNNGDLLVIKDVVSNSTKNITRENILKGTPLPADTVDTQAIEDDAVTTPKIDDGAVTASKLATGAVTNTQTTGATSASQTYTSISPACTIAATIGANGLALVSITSFLQANATNTQVRASVAVSGASTVAGSDTRSVMYQCYAANSNAIQSGTFLLTGLTPGSNTFTLVNRVNGNTGTYAYREISVVPL